MNSAPAKPDVTATLPRTFGRYQLFDRVGAGGMAEIYLARAHTELGGARLVVVKQILSELSDNERFADMLIQEAKLAARLNHANVVQVFDLGRAEGVLFIAMDYVEGFDLNELLRNCARSKVPLPIPFALLIATEALRGLDYAHRRCDDSGAPMGIVHRDVSPSNVLISFDGEIKLCDFGIARANDMADVLPEDAVKGKAGYMSPEQARGDPVDARSDIFALGIVLWELLAGRKLYKASEGGPSLLGLARAAQIPSLPSRQLPEEQTLHSLVSRALSVDREQRFSNAQSMLKALESYIVSAKLMASPIRFGEWLREHFGEDLIASRKARERAARAFELGPAAQVEAYGTPPPPAASEPAAPLPEPSEPTQNRGSFALRPALPETREYTPTAQDAVVPSPFEAPPLTALQSQAKLVAPVPARRPPPPPPPPPQGIDPPLPRPSAPMPLGVGAMNPLPQAKQDSGPVPPLGSGIFGPPVPGPAPAPLASSAFGAPSSGNVSHGVPLPVPLPALQASPIVSSEAAVEVPKRKRIGFSLWFALGVILGIVAIALVVWKW